MSEPSHQRTQEVVVTPTDEQNKEKSASVGHMETKNLTEEKKEALPPLHRPSQETVPSNVTLKRQHDVTSKKFLFLD